MSCGLRPTDPTNRVVEFGPRSIEELESKDDIGGLPVLWKLERRGDIDDGASLFDPDFKPFEAALNQLIGARRIAQWTQAHRQSFHKRAQRLHSLGFDEHIPPLGVAISPAIYFR